MSSPTYIIGHKNPDADAICSAIAYTALKHANGHKSCIAVRCGNSNPRIDAILGRFDIPLPPFIGDLTPRVQDIMVTDVHKVTPDATCAEALKIIDDHDVHCLPVVKHDNRIKGFLSIFHLGESFIPNLRNVRRMRHVRSSIIAITEALNGQSPHTVDIESVQDFYVHIGTMEAASLGKILDEENIAPSQSIIVTGDRRDLQKKAIELGVRLVVLTGATEPDASIVQAAKESPTSLIISPHNSGTTSWIIRSATSVESFIEKNRATFSPKETLQHVRKTIAYRQDPLFMVVDEEERLMGVFSKSDILKPLHTNIILVDHNELSQAVTGASEVNILEIVDHHRLGNPPTQHPILFINDPVGSTCTIITDLFRRHNVAPAPQIAGILMGGIISDTLNLQSPTTTEKDKALLPWLSSIAGIESSELAQIIFSAGSPILETRPSQVITSDCKAYTEGGVCFSISQVEELGFDNFWKHDQSLLVALSQHCERNQYYFSTLLVTDINSQNSLLAIVGDRGLIEKITYPTVRPRQIFELQNIVSRKKQLLPYLISLLESLNLVQ